MDGFETTRQIRSLSVPWAAKVPVVALTGHDLSRLRNPGQAAGMNEFLTKPVSLEAFFTTMARWIGPDGSAANVSSPGVSFHGAFCPEPTPEDTRWMKHFSLTWMPGCHSWIRGLKRT